MPSLPDLSPLGFALIVGGATLIVATLGFSALVRGRRHRLDSREIVSVVEEIRSGRSRRRAEIALRSPLAPVADAVNRLGEDLATRRSEAEAADPGLQAILEAARDHAVLTTDADWDVRSASPGAAAMFGFESDAMAGLSAATLFDDASWKDLIPRFARKKLRDRGSDGRCTMMRSDGSPFPARVTVRPHRRPGSESPGYLIVVNDITAEVRLENELRASEARYRLLVEGLPEAVAVVRGGAVVFANPAFAALLGLSANEALGLRLRDRIETSDVLVLQEALGRLEGAVEGERADLRLRLTGAREGGGPAVRLTATGVRHEGAPAVLLSLRDETAERRVDAELRRNESRLDAVVEAAAEGLVVLADAGAGRVVTMANAAFARLAGVDRDGLLGAGEAALADMLRARGEGGARLAALITATDPQPGRGTIEIDGAETRHVVEVAVAPMLRRDGRPEGRVLVLRDLSEARTAEQGLLSNVEDLRRAKDELEAAYRELQAEREDVTRRQDDLVRLNTELRSLDSMKTDLLANVSHELQTPLVSIRGYTEMILKGRLGPVNEEQRKGLTLSLRNIDRLIALIDNLLSFSRADRGAGEMNLSVFPIAAVVDEAIDLLRDRIESRGLTVSRNYEDARVEIRADRDKILQVFVNLLSNAVKFNRDRGSIEVVARCGKPGFALIQVHDTGLGIPEQEIEKVFDRFYRITTPGEAPREGSGVGLAIVRGILGLHGCVIRATSRVGEGTTFTFTLPLAVQVPAAAPRAPESDGATSPEVAPRQAARPTSPAPPAPPPPAPADRREGGPGVKIIRRA